MQTIITLTLVQLRMYLRDRQSVFLSLFFPLMLMFAFGFMSFDGPTETSIGVIGAENSDPAILEALDQSGLFIISQGGEEDIRAAIDDGDISIAVILPEGPLDTASSGSTVAIDTLVNAADPQRSQQGLAVLDAVLTRLSYDLRATEPMFALNPIDVDSRNLRYVDFLIPGLLAFMLMQLAITGSGFNVVEYKRKGILKRLFVTPLRPSHFVISLILMRLIAIFVQLALLLGLAMLVFQATIVGNFALLIGLILFGGVMFLALGFALGGIAKTQNAIILIGNLVIFPQMFLASVFFPLDSLPDWVQSLAGLLPLAFVSHSIRAVANDAAGLVELWPDMLGIAAWTAIFLFLAIRYFRWSDAAKV